MGKNVIRLVDNSWYSESSANFPLPEGFLTSHGKYTPSDVLNLVNSVNGYTIEELSDKEDGGILVWPQSFEKSHDKLLKKTILECKIEEKKVKSLSTNNLVGYIGDGKAQIEINSRFCSNTDGNDYFLYHMLAKVFHANIVNMEVGGGSLKELNLLIFMFPRLLKEALIQGVYKLYTKKEYNNSNLRGTVSINRHIRNNEPANGKIAYSTREFCYDNSMTQLIRHTIEYIYTLPLGRTLLKGDKTIEECVRLITQLTSSYEKANRRKVMADNKKLINHPYYTKYMVLQKICLAILKKERISHGSQNNNVHGLLIDMSWLWEEYIATILQDNLTGFKHYTDNESFKLFEKENDKRFQSVIPDYLCECENGYNIVADAKYIPLHKYDHLNADRASAVYYKTIMYMYRFHTNLGLLLHPCNKKDVEKIIDSNIENDIITCDYKIANDKDCHIYEIGFIVPECNDSFKEKIEKMEMCFVEKITDIKSIYHKSF